MQNEQENLDSFNSQTKRLRFALQNGERLATRRTSLLGQIFFCEGCCCGRTDRGFPPLPKAMIKEHWKRLRLNNTIQLTISGCLGPCDLANVFYFLPNVGNGQWYGGLSENWQYELLIQWAKDCQKKDSLVPIPLSLASHRFVRFDSPPTDKSSCSTSETSLPETS